MRKNPQGCRSPTEEYWGVQSKMPLVTLGLIPSAGHDLGERSGTKEGNYQTWPEEELQQASHLRVLDESFTNADMQQLTADLLLSN